MSLNYQRDSYSLWESALKTYNDEATTKVFNLKYSANQNEDDLRALLTKHKLALQPNRHVDIWHRISSTINQNWGKISELLNFSKFDFLKLKKTVQVDFKKGFPYLSGPKIFNYWSFILQKYGEVKLSNSEYIEIAPDTHIIQASVRLGVISDHESKILTREEISEKWRNLLKDSGITPIEMHSPLWFWSRNGFIYEV